MLRADREALARRDAMLCLSGFLLGVAYARGGIPRADLLTAIELARFVPPDHEFADRNAMMAVRKTGEVRFHAITTGEAPSDWCIMKSDYDFALLRLGAHLREIANAESKSQRSNELRGKDLAEDGLSAVG